MPLSELEAIGLIEHIADLHRQIGDMGGEDCPFVRYMRRAKENPTVEAVGGESPDYTADQQREAVERVGKAMEGTG